jgi:hypothetical protein
MPGLSVYAQQKLNDHVRGKAAFTMPATYLALFRATAGRSPRSTAVTVGQTTIPATQNGRMYRCSVAGTTGAAEPTWPTTTAGSVVDGGATWVEMTTDFETNSAVAIASEANYTSYARTSVPAASWTTASGVNGPNAAVINAPAATGGSNEIGQLALYDALTVGNMLAYGPLNLAGPVTTGVTVSFDIGQLVLTLD